jgi:hypothetical protein
MAAYVSTAGPRRVDSGILSRRNRNESTGAEDGGAVWSYSSTATLANMKSTGWFSNAGRLGMLEGDIVMAVGYNSAGVMVDFNIGILTPVSTSANGAAELFAGTTVTST